MDYYVIYYKPIDFPEHWAVRHFDMNEDMRITSGDARRFESLADARNYIPPGRICVFRHNEDDPVIIETWI